MIKVFTLLLVATTMWWPISCYIVSDLYYAECFGSDEGFLYVFLQRVLYDPGVLFHLLHEDLAMIKCVHSACIIQDINVCKIYPPLFHYADNVYIFLRNWIMVL
jgi:hypothetical protein